MTINIPQSAHNHLLWAMYLLSKQSDLSQFRFYAKPGLAIKYHEIDRIEKSDNGLHEVWINFGGIDGVNGPLPIWLKELLLIEYHEASHSDEKKRPLGDFINIFSHRLTYWLYQAWLKNKSFLIFNPINKDKWTHLLLALTNQLDITGNNSVDVSHMRFLPYVAALGGRSQSLTTLQGMLRHFFIGIPIHVKLFMKRYIDIPKESQISFGKRLEENLFLGQRMADISGAFRIIIGPMKKEDYERFLPNGPYYHDLTYLVQMMVSKFLDWDIELRLEAKDIPELIIGNDYNPKLGYNTWLSTTDNKKRDGVNIFQKNDR